MGKEINILLCLNQGLYRQMFVLMESVFKNNKDKKILFHVFETDFLEEQKEYLIKFVECNGGELKIKHIKEEMLDGFNGIGRIPQESYCRIFCVELLPDSIDRVLYLDVDIIVDKPLNTLYNSDFEGAPMIACRTPISKVTFDEFVKLSAAEKARYNYFNAGVILFNLSKLRNMGCNIDWFKQKYNELVLACKKINPMMRRPYREDQGLLNSLFGATAKYVDDIKYNYRPAHICVYGKKKLENILAHEKESGTVIHYTCDACEKPWNYYFKKGEALYRTDDFERKEMLWNLANKWWSYAVATPFYFSLKKEADIRTDECLKLDEMYNGRLKAEKKYEGYLIREMRYLQNICYKLQKNPRYIWDWMNQRGYINVAMHTQNTIADSLRRLFAEAGINISYFVNWGREDGIECLAKDTAAYPKVDAIVICDIDSSENIKKNLIKSGKVSDFPIISIYDIIDNNK